MRPGLKVIPGCFATRNRGTLTLALRSSPETSHLFDDPLWHRLDTIVRKAPTRGDVLAHGLGAFAARTLRDAGRPVPAEYDRELRHASLSVLAAPTLLAQALAAIGEPVVLLKGYEAGVLYPDPATRPFRDLDLLVMASRTAQVALLDAGFVVVGDPDPFKDIHHERPVWLAGFPIVIEVHHRPKWPDELRPLPSSEIFANAVPSATGVPGLLAPSRAQHAVLLAAHSWAHVPLRRLLDLVDIAVVSAGIPRDELAAVASDWGLTRVWRTTIDCVDGLFYDRPRALAQRTWARQLASGRERTVFESHLEKWLSPFSARPFREGVRALGETLIFEFRTAEGEDWREKATRTRRALRNAFARRSEHAEQLGSAAHRRRRPR